MSELRITVKPRCIAPTLNSATQASNNSVVFNWNSHGMNAQGMSLLLECSLDGGQSYTSLASVSPALSTYTAQSNLFESASNGQAIKYRVTLTGNRCGNLHSNIIDGVWEKEELIYEVLSENESCGQKDVTFKLTGNTENKPVAIKLIGNPSGASFTINTISGNFSLKRASDNSKIFSHYQPENGTPLKHESIDALMTLQGTATIHISLQDSNAAWSLGNHPQMMIIHCDEIDNSTQVQTFASFGIEVNDTGFNFGGMILNSTKYYESGDDFLN